MISAWCQPQKFLFVSHFFLVGNFGRRRFEPFLSSTFPFFSLLGRCKESVSRREKRVASSRGILRLESLSS